MRFRLAAAGAVRVGRRHAQQDLREDGPTFERQLTRIRPLRASVPATRNVRPFSIAVILVRAGLEPPIVAPGGGTVTDASAALCGPPRPCESSSHIRTVYTPGPGAVICPAPLDPIVTAAGHEL
jgi:hypothetical protein